MLAKGGEVRVLAWDRDWETGVAGLDQQHQAMVAAFNRLAEAVRADRAQAEVKQAISFLLMYTETHFKDEEALMERHGYPELAAHREEHEDCPQRIDGLLALCRNGDPGTLDYLIDFFEHWLVSHFEGSDRRLKGLAGAGH